MKLSLAIAALGASLGANVSFVAASATHLRGASEQDHRVLQDDLEVTYLMGVVEYEGKKEDGILESFELDGQVYDMTDLPPGWQGKGKDLVSGFSKMKIPAGTTLGGGKANMNGRAPRDSLPERHERDLAAFHDSRRLAVTGTKTIDITWVNAPDAGTSALPSQLNQAWFADPANFKSQTEACSYGKVTVTPSIQGSALGVTSVSISQTVSGVADSTVRSAIGSARTAIYGNARGSATHVAYCVPPGTSGGWIAYAYVNHWLSVYNNNWCTYLSGQMHEIGHNWSLAHSGEGSNAYGDQSGMMGYSYGSSDTPLMCFNGAKMWQLGWYTDKQVVLGADGNNCWEGEMKGLSHYDNNLINGIVLLQIPTAGTDDFYVNFNRKSGINAGTVEGGNQVLVTKRTSGTGYAASTLMSKLSASGFYSIPDTSLVVKVQSINLSTNVATITVSASGEAGSCVPGTTPPPTPTPAPTTPPPTLAPTPSPTPSPTTLPPTPSPTPAPTPGPTTSPTTLPPTISPKPTPPPTPTPTSPPTTAVVTYLCARWEPSPASICLEGSTVDCAGQCNGQQQCWSTTCGGGGPTPTPPTTPPPTLSPKPTPGCNCSLISDRNTCNGCGGGNICSWSGKPKSCQEV